MKTNKTKRWLVLYLEGSRCVEILVKGSVASNSLCDRRESLDKSVEKEFSEGY